MLRRFKDRHRNNHHDEYPPDRPVVYGPPTLAEFMEGAAWQLDTLGKNANLEHGEAYFEWLLTLGGDMTECTTAVLAHPGFDQIALARAGVLAERGIDVAVLHQVTAKAREFRTGIVTGEVLRLVVDAWNQADNEPAS